MGKQLRTIVAAVDLSATSDAAWAAACRLAVDTDSRVHLLHVSPDPLSQAWTVEAIGVDFPAIAEAWRQQWSAHTVMVRSSSCSSAASRSVSFAMRNAPS